MAKVKLLRFEAVALLEESKKLMDYLQRLGVVQIENADGAGLTKYDTDSVADIFERYRQTASKTIGILEKFCSIKKPLTAVFHDYSEIDYNDFRLLCGRADEIYAVCGDICKLESELEEQKAQIIRLQTKLDYLKPWLALDIPMSCTRTLKAAVIIGSFKKEISEPEIKAALAQLIPEIEGVEVQIISSSKPITCAVALCHISDSSAVEAALKKIGFARPDNPEKKLVKDASADYEKQIEQAKEKIEEISLQIGGYAESYGDIRFVSDYFLMQKEKYEAVKNAGITEKTIYLSGYVPERSSEELKFELEKRFTAQVELFEPDYEDEDVPVLIENKSFAAGVESISNMYSPPSNSDVDPNPVMAFFYYALFGLMLSDAGYGLLIVIAALVAKFRFKVQGNMKKTADFGLYCGISTVIWGALFGGWFGDLIPTICTAFLGMEKGPDLALWFSPVDRSMDLLLYSFLFGIIHLFAGLAVRFYTLAKKHDFIGAVCDVIPVYVFISGFAVIGKNFISPVSQQAKTVGMRLLAAGAVLIILTAGRSSKNILGKLGGGFYGLYNTTTGYLGDILSYSRLLALNLVTGIIANVVNLLAAMFKNPILFVIIFILGHTVNLAINLIGTYVHTNRLQYVEFFSKFYEGGGRIFTPLRINSKYHKFKEETINE